MQKSNRFLEVALSDKTVTFKFTAKSHKGGKIILLNENIGGMKHGNIKM